MPDSSRASTAYSRMAFPAGCPKNAAMREPPETSPITASRNSMMSMQAEYRQLGIGLGISESMQNDGPGHQSNLPGRRQPVSEYLRSGPGIQRPKDEKDCQRRKGQELFRPCPRAPVRQPETVSPHAIAIACRSAPTKTTLPPARNRIRARHCVPVHRRFQDLEFAHEHGEGRDPDQHEKAAEQARSPHRRRPQRSGHLCSCRACRRSVPAALRRRNESVLQIE